MAIGCPPHHTASLRSYADVCRRPLRAAGVTRLFTPCPFAYIVACLLQPFQAQTGAMTPPRTSCAVPWFLVSPQGLPLRLDLPSRCPVQPSAHPFRKRSMIRALLFLQLGCLPMGLRATTWGWGCPAIATGRSCVSSARGGHTGYIRRFPVCSLLKQHYIQPFRPFLGALFRDHKWL